MKNKWFKDNVPASISDVVCRISIVLDEENVVVHDFLSQLDVDYDNLEEELEVTPSVFAYWTFVLAEAESQLAIIERNVKYKRGLLYNALLTEYDDKTSDLKSKGYAPDRLPQWQAKELVESDEDLNREEMKLILAKRNFAKVRAIVDSIKMKAEHLRSLAGFKRQEKFNSK